jgi:divalent metal cation (Fe/Co/Zn/Cd) transporter
VGAIDSQQRDLLFLSGFKSMPKYYFFDLLIFVVENLTILEAKEETNEEELRIAKVEEIKTQILIILDA